VQEEKAALLAETGINIRWFAQDKAAQRQALLFELNAALARVTQLEEQLEQAENQKSAVQMSLDAVRTFQLRHVRLRIRGGYFRCRLRAQPRFQSETFDPIQRNISDFPNLSF
jgi:hypothetical protein